MTPDEKMLHFTVNGKNYALPEVAGEKLSDLLRIRLGLTGTKIGCGEGRCGICTVLVDGKPTRSCLTRSAKIDGSDILTIEGLRALRPENFPPASIAGVEDLSLLHPLQQAFVTHGAVQCGFCTPGQIMRAYALLRDNPDPSYAEIKAALEDVVCRCGGYNLIAGAVKATADALREHKAIADPTLPLIKSDYAHIGKVAARPDAVAKVNGTARFTDDFSFDGMLYARVARARVPSAILTGLDTSEAARLPGVVAVMTATDLPAARHHGVYVHDWPILVGVGERVRYMGDAIALIGAETQAIADEAVELVKAQFETRPVISDPVEGLKPDAELLHKSGNLLKHIKVRRGNVESGFAESAAVIEHVFHTPSSDHFFMEPECSIGLPREDGGFDLLVGSQIPYADRKQVAAALGVAEDQVRVRGQRTGGGFGGKEDIAGQIHACLLAQKTGRPVKVLFTRRESLLVHPKRHATQIRIKLGASKEGKLLAAETELYGDTGAYASLGDKVMTRAATHSTGPYAIPNAKVDCYAVYTNNPPAGAFRGFGVMQSAFIIESALDMLAEKLGIDPLQIRLINALKPGDLTNTGQLLDSSAGLPDCLKGIARRWQELGVTQPFVPAEEIVDGKPMKTCWGLAAAFKNTGLGGGADDASGAEVSLLKTNRLRIKTAASEIGQGMVTTLAIIAAEVLKLPLTQINVFLMDTDLTPDGGPTTASRQTFVSGNAVKLASEQLKASLLKVGAVALGVDESVLSLSENGLSNGSQTLNWHRLWELLGEPERSALVYYHAPATKSIEEGGRIHVTYGFSAQAVKIAVDEATGKVKVLKVLTANDAGKVINPLGYQGQVEGGVVMGVGQALIEEFKVNAGIIESDRAARYPIPRMQDTPEIESIIVEAEMKDGPFGAKGVGEITSIPTPPAIANAIYHATGVRYDRLPIRLQPKG
jgi:CO/xanthine dehydrogenase Mo-binding subunit/aerobic-type carbon monoxide dehydrogenase small subunit (CoxS/CutS family)